MNTINEQQKVFRQQKSIEIDSKYVKSFESAKTYDPFDFSLAKRSLDKVQREKLEFATRSNAGFNRKKVDPIDFYCMPQLFNQYLTSSGKILSRSVTGLASKKQKRLAKAIRRARAFGLLSHVSKDINYDFAIKRHLP